MPLAVVVGGIEGCEVSTQEKMICRIRSEEHELRSVRGVRLSPDGLKVLTMSYNFNCETRLQLWDLATAKEVMDFEAGINLFEIMFAPSGDHVLASDEKDGIKCFSCATGEAIASFEHGGPEEEPAGMAVAADGTTVLTVLRADKEVRFWELTTGARIKTLNLEAEEVFTMPLVCCHPSKNLLSASSGNNAGVWSTDTGKLIQLFSGHTDIVTSAVFSSSGEQVLTGSEDRTVKLFSLDTGACLWTIQASSPKEWEFVRFSELCSEDKFLMTNHSPDKVVRIFSVETGKELKFFTNMFHGTFGQVHPSLCA